MEMRRRRTSAFGWRDGETGPRLIGRETLLTQRWHSSAALRRLDVDEAGTKDLVVVVADECILRYHAEEPVPLVHGVVLVEAVCDVVPRIFQPIRDYGCAISACGARKAYTSALSRAFRWAKARDLVGGGPESSGGKQARASRQPGSKKAR
jgi:hypothetical protein